MSEYQAEQGGGGLTKSHSRNIPEPFPARQKPRFKYLPHFVVVDVQ
jgi:hypothetical protein